MSEPITRLNAALEGRYRIESELGEGGMATVYLADDLKHERKVALKVLKPELAAVVGAERFLAEIKTTANLQHPHILPLFDSGEADSFLFYVMPYVEGESLRERLDRERQLPVDDAVRITTNVAEALDYAHRQGVIHRDIKPANILLQDGKPVISDFGIALAVNAGGGGRLTETGLSLGTPHYMSPEQATGDIHVGSATDIYALGCVLYEMLVGEPPYTGGSPQAILGKIIAGELAPATKERATVPANVDAAMNKALEKVPADRFTGAQDLAAALDDPWFRWPIEGASAAKPAKSTLGLAALAGWGVAAASIVLWLAVPRASESDPSTVRSLFATIELPDSAPVATGSARTVAVAPDGSEVVYVAQNTETTRLYRRALGYLGSSEPTAATPIAGTDGAVTAFFSPSGDWLGFLTVDGEILKTPVAGGPIKSVGSGVHTSMGVTWTFGAIVVGYDDGNALRVFPDDGSASTEVRFSHGLFFSASRLPIPGWLLGNLGDRRIGVVDMATGDLFVLTPDGLADYVETEPTFGLRGNAPRFVGDGHIVWTGLDGVLQAVSFDLDEMRLTAEPAPVLSGVRTAQYLAAGQWAVTEDGHLVYAPGDHSTAGRFALLDEDGTVEELAVPERKYGAFAASPDRRRIATQVMTPVGIMETRVLNPSTGEDERLYSGWAYPGVAWWPDGESLLYRTISPSTDGVSHGELIRHDVGNLTTMDTLPYAAVPESVTRDGRWLVASRWGYGDPPPGIWVYDVQSDDERRFDDVLTATTAMLSPDELWLAWSRFQDDDYHLIYAPFDNGDLGEHERAAPGFSPTWSLDGQRIYVWNLETRSVGYVDWIQATGRFEPAGSISVPRLIDVPGRDLDVWWDGRILFVAADDEVVVDRLHLITDWVNTLSGAEPGASGP